MTSQTVEMIMHILGIWVVLGSPVLVLVVRFIWAGQQRRRP